MFASMYQRRRTQCCMNGGGPGSGVFKSTDGGETWTRVDRAAARPARWAASRWTPIAAAANIVYALGGRPVAAGRGGGGGGWRRWRSRRCAAAVRRGWRGAGGGPDRPLPVGRRRRDVEAGEQRQSAADVLQPGAHRSRTIPIAFTWAASACRCRSTAAARSRPTRRWSIHDDIHAIWINPANPNHILIGGDGGVAVSYDMSKTWFQHHNLPLALFYHVVCRHGDAVQRLRRPAGQLQLVRTRARRGSRAAS